jgi:hypothetical protein
MEPSTSLHPQGQKWRDFGGQEPTVPKETPEEAGIDDGARLVVEAIPPHPPSHPSRPLQLRAHKSSDLKEQSKG